MAAPDPQKLATSEAPAELPTATAVDGPEPAWIFQTKTTLAAAVCAIVPAVFPPVAAFMAANPAACNAALMALFGLGLRAITTRPATFARPRKPSEPPT